MSKGLSFRFAGVLAGLSTVLALACISSTAAVVKDAGGVSVNLPDHPIRIVTLAPSLGELAADVLDGHVNRIIGVSDYTDYPTTLEKIASIGSYARFNLEKVMALKPDLVLATLDGNAKDQVDHLRELGAPVVVVGTAGFDQVAQSIRLIGEAVGETKRAGELATRFSDGLTKIRKKAGMRRQGQKSPSVLLQLNDSPLMTAGKGTFLNEAIEAIGARNLYGDSRIAYPKPSMEDVLMRKPDVIVVLAMTGQSEVFEKMAEEWKRYEKLPATKSGRIRIIKADTVTRPTLRLLEGLSLLERAVYGP